MRFICFFCFFFLLALAVVLFSQPSMAQTCTADSPVGPLQGHCVFVDKGSKKPPCPGGWPSTNFFGCPRAPGTGAYSCCIDPTPCSVPGFGRGLCLDRTDGSCPPRTSVWKVGYCFGKGHNVECCVDGVATLTKGPGGNYSPDDVRSTTTSVALKGLYSLGPATAASFFIPGSDGLVKFIATGGDLPISQVTIFLNGQSLGDATRCSESTWCFDLWFGRVHHSPSVLTANPNAGPSVSYTIPLFSGSWLWSLLGSSPSNPTLSVPVTLAMNAVRGPITYPFGLPVIGFDYTYTSMYGFSLTISPGGHITAAINGSRTDEFKPYGPYLHTRWGLAIAGGLEMKTVESKTAHVFEPAFQSGTVSVTGTLYLPTPLTWGKTFSILGRQIGVNVEVSFVFTSAVTVTFARDPNASFLGWPAAVVAVDGTLLAVGAAVTGSVSLGVSAMVLGQLTIGPTVHWDAASGGMRITGCTINGFVTATATVGPFSATATIIHWTKTNDKKQSQFESVDSLMDEIKRGSASIDPTVVLSAASPIENVWAPLIISASNPFLVDNVFPSTSLGTASARGKDVLLWLSFDPSKQFPQHLQVQYSWRANGGKWSDLSFVPSGNYPMVMPALEDIESTGQIMLVASELLTANVTTFDEMQLRLVYSFFDTQTNTWTPYQPVFDHMPTGADWVPVFSESGLWMAFVRAPQSGVGTGMYSSQFINGRWTEPLVIMSPMEKVLSFSLDASPKGDSAMIAYVTDAPNINLCFFELGNWSCSSSLHTVTENTSPTVTYTSDAYLLVWAINNTIYSTKISTHGEQLNRFALQTEQNVKGMVAGVCELAGPGTVLVGWNEHVNTSLNTVFHYALADPSGALHYAPINVAPQIDTDDSKVLQTTGMQLAWTGSHLLYATMVSANRTGQQRASVAAFDLSFRGDVHVSNPRFSPDDFSTPLVNVTVTLTNIGLSIVPAGGDAIFAFVTPSEMEYVVGSTKLTAPLQSHQSVDVSIVWNTAVNTSEGGVLQVMFFGVNGTMNDHVLQVDPAAFGLSNSSITSMPNSNQSAVAVFLTVIGPAVTDVELQAWTRASEVGNAILLGSTKHRTKPHSNEPVFIPMTNTSSVFRNLQIRVLGSHQRASLHTTAYDERYDFAMLLSEIDYEPLSSEDNSISRYRIKLPIRNYGNTGATVRVRARVRETDSTEYSVLDLTTTYVGGMSLSNASLEVTLRERHNMVHLQVNCDDQPLPELNRENNEVWIALLNDRVPEQASLLLSTDAATAPPSTSAVDVSIDAPVSQLGASHSSSNKALTIIVTVSASLAVIFGAVLLLSAFALLRLRNRAATGSTLRYRLHNEAHN